MDLDSISLDEIEGRVGKVYDLWLWLAKRKYEDDKNHDKTELTEDLYIRQFILAKFERDPASMKRES